MSEWKKGPGKEKKKVKRKRMHFFFIKKSTPQKRAKEVDGMLGAPISQSVNRWKKLLEEAVYVYDIDHGDDFTGVCFFPNSSNYTH